ncbi:MAG: HAD-IA family hydrolase [Elusimicrobia bacterium]|nr:HAD-IA family hydrolase [Elusimicrobiota bacterium]
MTLKIKKNPLIVFDIGNVLLRFSKERARLNFDRIEPGAGLPLVRAMWETRLGVDLERGRISGREFLRLAGRKAGVRMGYRSFCRAFQDIFTPLLPNIRLLVRLAQRYPTALLSNTSEVHWRHLFKTYPDLRIARWKFASHLLKAMKPDARVYQAVSTKTGFSFQDMIYIDDHPGFVRAAKGLGIQAVCYNGKTPLVKLLKKVGLR